MVETPAVREELVSPMVVVVIPCKNGEARERWKLATQFGRLIAAYIAITRVNGKETNNRDYILI